MGEAIITRRGGGKPTGLYAWAKYSQTVLPFSNSTSWADIGGAIAADINGNVDLSKHWNIGDTKDVTLTTGETIQLQIAGFNHDTYSDGVTAPVSLVMKDCLNTKAQMNSSDYNTGGYPASAMKTWVENNIYNKLPSDLKSIVAPAKKKWYTTYNDANSLTESNYNVWLLSEAEIRNNANLTIGEGEGTKYPIFTYNDASRIKKVNGTASYWWLGSCDKYNSTSFVCVDYDGGTRNGYAITNPMGVAVGLLPRGTTPQLQKTFIEYVVSDNENAYPDKAVHTDGYYYEKVGGGPDLSSVGFTKGETIEVDCASQTTFTVSHSLGVIPKLILLVGDGDISYGRVSILVATRYKNGSSYYYMNKYGITDNGIAITDVFDTYYSGSSGSARITATDTTITFNYDNSNNGYFSRGSKYKCLVLG